MDIRYVISNARQQARTHGIAAAVRSLSRRARVRWREWRLGIRTEGSIELTEFGISNPECRHYTTTSYGDFPKIMGALEIDPREHVFLDYGAGMGRALILAAQYPFKRVIGVDIVPELTAIARQNVARCRAKLRCQDIEISTSDATLYPIPADATVFYVANSFNGGVLSLVLDRIRVFATGAPRPILFVCNVPERSGFEYQVRKESWLRLRKALELEDARRCLVFEAGGERSDPK